MRRLLITGASGQIGPYLLREAMSLPLAITAWGHAWQGPLPGIWSMSPAPQAPLVSTSQPPRAAAAPTFDDILAASPSPSPSDSVAPQPPRYEAVDLTDRQALDAAFARAAPDIVVHAAAMSSIAACHAQPDLAQRLNADATAHLAELCRQAGARLIYLSTDMVFTGERTVYDAWYRETDKTEPRTTYARTKLAGEQPVLAYRQGLVLRIGLMYGPTLNGRPKFFDGILAALRGGPPATLFKDEYRTPLPLDAGSRAILAAARSDVAGLLHLAGPARMSRLDMGTQLAKYLGLDTANLIPAPRDSVPAPEPRAPDTSLDSSRFRAAFPGLSIPSYFASLPSLLG